MDEALCIVRKNNTQFTNWHYEGDFNERFMLKLHSFILKDIDDGNAGRYREIQVFIGGEDVKFPFYKDVPKLMEELFVWYKENKKVLHVLELAALTSIKFVSIVLR